MIFALLYSTIKKEYMCIYKQIYFFIGHLKLSSENFSKSNYLHCIPIQFSMIYGSAQHYPMSSHPQIEEF